MRRCCQQTAVGKSECRRPRRGKVRSGAGTWAGVFRIVAVAVHFERGKKKRNH